MAARTALSGILGATAVGALVALLALATAAPAGAGLMLPKAEFATGAGPRTTAIADLDADGTLDLVVANGAADTVSVLRGNGDGTFAAKADYATGSVPYGVVTGEFNGDGLLDVAVANSGSGSLSILLGDGAGHLSGRTDYATGNGAYAIATGDANRDGWPDLATANFDDDTVTVLFGTAAGVLSAPTTLAAGSHPASIAFADIKGVGKDGLVVANSGSNTVTVFVHNIVGNLSVGGTYATGGYPSGVTVADLNGDGRLDVATNDWADNTVSVLLQTGHAVLGARVAYAVGREPTAIAAGDVNGDGRPDLETSNADSSTVSVLLGRGDGTFKPQAEFASGPVPINIRAADLDGDGKDDLVLTDLWVATVSVLRAVHATGFSTRTAYPTLPGPDMVAIGDVDGDGSTDVVVAGDSAFAVSVLHGNGDGTLGARTDITLPDQPKALAVGDANGDGRNDIALCVGSSEVVVLLGNGAGGFAAPVQLLGAPFSNHIAIGTFGAGQTPGVATSSESGQVAITVWDPSHGIFADPQAWAVALGTAALALTDVDADGSTDIVTVGGDVVTTLRATALGFTRTDTTLASFQGTGWTGLAAGDLTRDGKADIALLNPNQTMLATGDGSGGFALTAGGMNGGGNPCAIAAWTGAQPVVLYTRCGVSDLVLRPVEPEGTLPSGPSVSTGATPRAVAVGDLDGDGSPDVVTADSGQSAVSVFVEGSPGIAPTRLKAIPVDALPPSLSMPGATGSSAYRVVSGSLPAGIVLARSGAFSGRATTPGVSTFAITGHDAVALGTRTYRLRVIAITTPSLPSGAAGAAYSAAVTGSGLAPRSFSVSAGSLPPGLMLAADGTLSGVPAATGSFSFTVRALDVDGSSGAATASYTVAVGGMASLALDAAPLSPSFSPATFAYAAAVGSATGGITVTPAFTEGYTLTVSSGAVTVQPASGAPVAVVLGAPGSTTTITLALAAPGTPTITYTVAVARRTPPSPAAAPASLAFGSVAMGSSAGAPQRTTLANGGDEPLTVLGVTTFGEFPTWGSSCEAGTTLAPGASCTVDIGFAPIGTGTRSGVAILTTSAGAVVVPLAGTGLAPATPAVGVAPASLAFGPVRVGSASAGELVTVSSTGTAPLPLTSIGTSGDFALTGTTCPLAGLLQAGSSCTATVVFQPAAAGTRTGTLLVGTGAGLAAVSLTGTGALPAASLAPASLAFGEQRFDTSSPTRTLTLTSTGAVPLAVLSLSASGDFAATPACPASLAPGQSCTIAVAFRPLGDGPRNGTLAVTTDAGVLTSALTGSGTGLVPKSEGGGYAVVGSQKVRVEWSLRAPRPGAVKGKLLVVRYTQAGASYVLTASLVTDLTVTLAPSGGRPAASHFEGSGTLERNGVVQAGGVTFAFDSLDKATPGAGSDTFSVSISGPAGYAWNAGSPAAQLVLAYGELGNLMI